MKKVVARYFAFLVMAMMVLITLGNAQADDQPRVMYVAVSSDSCLNMRNQPKQKSETVYKLERNMAVNVHETKGNWVYVDFCFEYGWVANDYLVNEPLVDEPMLDSPIDTVIVSNARVQLRKEPNGKRVKWLYNGDQVTVLGYEADKHGVRWARVEGGYVMAEYTQGKD